MRKFLCLLIVCILIVPFHSIARSPRRTLVKGGEMMLNGKWISVESFHISRYEITNAQYASFLNAEKIGSDGMHNGRKIINVTSEDLQLEYINEKWVARVDKENYPMVMVNYYGANEFCKWAGGLLPDKTQWTYAAKGGMKSKNYSYAGGNNLDEVGWFKGNSEGHSHVVGKKKPNELGIYDMSGNAWEWCRNDSLKSENDLCLHMGGSWFPGEQPSQISAHFGNTPTHFSNSVGFRIIYLVREK